jgi:hypothetical protein
MLSQPKKKAIIATPFMRLNHAVLVFLGAAAASASESS